MRGDGHHSLLKKKRPGLTGAIRRGFNVLCRSAATGKALVSIIPNDLMITSAVSGGLNVIFVALEQHGIYEAKLYARVCEVLDYILRWMMDNVFVSRAKSMLELNRYSKDLKDKMAEVRLAAQTLEKWANTLLLQSQKNMFNMHLKLGHQLENFEKRFEDRLDELSSQIQRANKLEFVVPMIFNDFKLVLNDEWHHNPRIRAWLSLDSPSLLLVNGSSTSHLDLSTSFFSAKIIDTLTRQLSQPHKDIEIIPLAYFCVQHKNYSKDVAAHPAELAMSLLLQLVDMHRSFKPKLLQKCLDETKPYNITSIFESLARLLDGLPPEAMVFVIIDGIEHFTRPDERRIGLREVCSQLLQVFREQRVAKVKLLFTSAQKAVMLEALGLIMDDEIVNIPKSPPPRGQPNDRNILIEL
ncbi:hypothetical protein LA080_011423 [Diaporthe eres]|nr:hypothetical protein LA080_011423 [Diaporthe eres]